MPVTADNLSTSAKRRMFQTPTITKSSGLSAAIVQFDYPVLIKACKTFVTTTFAANGLAAGDIDIGTAAGGAQVVAASGAVGATDAAGTVVDNPVVNNVTGMTGFLLGAGQALHIATTTPAGAGAYALQLFYEPVEVS